jgi:hypothetical protein
MNREIGKMTIEIPLSIQGKNAGKYTAIVDDCDADLAELRWRVEITSTHCIYAVRANRDFDIPIKERMHRVILEDMLERPLKECEFVDHVNGNGLDNRRGNLRLATKSQNAQNRRKVNGTTSQYKGTTWDKHSNKWKAQIRHNGKLIHLGLFDTEADAHRAYCEKAKELFGEFYNDGTGG